MKIMFLTNLMPYPLNSGSAVHTSVVLTALKEMECTVDFLCFREGEEVNSIELKNLCREIMQVPLNLITAEHKYEMLLKGFKSLFSPLPFVVYKYRSRDMQKDIQKLMRANEYDVVFIEHFNLGIYFSLIDRLKSKKTKVILIEQNCEYKIMESNAASKKNLLKKLIYKIETIKVKRFECSLVEKVNLTVFLTQEDHDEIRKEITHDIPYAVVPTGIPAKIRKRIPEDIEHKNPIRMMFLGVLTWEPNNHGILWFLKNIMDRLSMAEDVELYIIGKNPSTELRKEAARHKNVYVTGFVDSLDEYFDLCDVMISPIYIGSGIKTKILDAYSRGCPVIASTFSTIGIVHEDGKSILIADTAEDYIHALKQLRNQKFYENLSDNCYQIYLDTYSDGVTKKKIANYISRLTQ